MMKETYSIIKEASEKIGDGLKGQLNGTADI